VNRSTVPVVFDQRRSVHINEMLDLRTVVDNLPESLGFGGLPHFILRSVSEKIANGQCAVDIPANEITVIVSVSLSGLYTFLALDTVNGE
jgi:hypothetical protein